MTDRIQSCTVVFDHDIRTDDVEPLLDAIRQLRGVLSVTPGEPVSLSDWSARERVTYELREKIWKVLDPNEGEKR